MHDIDSTWYQYRGYQPFKGQEVKSLYKDVLIKEQMIAARVEPSIKAKPKGEKHDSGKSRVDLLEPEFLIAMGEVLKHGADKYSINNWQVVDDFKSRYKAAALRHLLAYMDGELIDKDSGCEHLAMAATNLMFLHWGEKNEAELS